MAKSNEQSPYHPAVVPGIEWTHYWRQKQLANVERYRAELAQVSPDRRLVDPPAHSD